jgi:hypothetical protein
MLADLSATNTALKMNLEDEEIKIKRLTVFSAKIKL